MSVLRSEVAGAFNSRLRHVRGSASRHPWRLAAAAAAVLAVAGLGAWIGVSRSGGGSGDVPLPTIQQILPPLTRSGETATGIGIDAVYAPEVYFRVSGFPAPTGAGAGSSVVFFLSENIHEGFLPARPPRALLSIDGAAGVAPLSSSVVNDDYHHRTTELVFPARTASGGTVREGDRHAVSLLLPDAKGAVSADGTLTWRLPVALSTGAAATPTEQSAAQEAESGAIGLSALTRSLHKSVGGVTYGGVPRVAVDAIYATSGYFKDALPQDAVAHYQPAKYFVFVVTATSHTEPLPHTVPPVRLQVDGKSYAPDLTERKIWSPHHQVVFVRFPADARLAKKAGVMRLQVSDTSSLSWVLPVDFKAGGAMSPFGIQWASLLALLGGFLGAMWPCLFQLTVFFMPALAGVGAEQMERGDHRGARRQIGRAAFFFVLGFTLVYTAAGAIIGLAAQQLHDTSQFESYQHYFGIAAGLVILVLALRVAIKGRAPLVCKMPIGPKIKKRSGASPWEMMMAGLAFATGCMTCFGSAIVIGMVVYVGLANSVVYGAFILFLFSLGMGIPLGIAAMAMGRVMPLMGKMEKWMPWMALTSAAIMVGYGGLLISGNYMALSSWIYRLTS